MYLRRLKKLYLWLILCTWQTWVHAEKVSSTDDDDSRHTPEPKPELNSPPNLQPDQIKSVTIQPEPTTTDDEWEFYYSESEVEYDPNSKHLLTSPPPTATTTIVITTTTTTPAPPTTLMDSDRAKQMEKEMAEYAKQPYDAATQESNNYWVQAYFNLEWLFGWGKPYGDETYRHEYLRTCYFIGTTYQNAITDIRHYYRTRFLYVNNLQYEVGFLTHEIVFKYQTMLEMFHIVQQRFLYNRTRYYAPTPYMLYMYGNILDASKQIIHLCNMMHELEKKYKKRQKTVFEDYHLPKKDVGADKFKDRNRLAYEHAKLKQAEQNRRERQLLKQRNKNFRDGIFTRPPRPPKKKNKMKWPHHYGWSVESIENWPQKHYPADPRPNPHRKK